MKNKLITLLGFARRSRKLLMGEGLVLEQIKREKVKVVILAVDAGKNTAKRILDKSEYRGIPVIQEFTREEIGRFLGEERVVLGVADPNFSREILKIWGGINHEQDQSIPAGQRFKHRKQGVGGDHTLSGDSSQ